MLIITGFIWMLMKYGLILRSEKVDLLKTVKRVFQFRVINSYLKASGHNSHIKIH